MPPLNVFTDLELISTRSFLRPGKNKYPPAFLHRMSLPFPMTKTVMIPQIIPYRTDSPFLFASHVFINMNGYGQLISHNDDSYFKWHYFTEHKNI